MPRSDLHRILLTASMVVGALLLLFVGAVGTTSAFMPDCARCHLAGEFAEASGASRHSALECSTCHGGVSIESRVVFGANQVLGMYLPLLKVDPTLASVHPDKCNSCHRDAIGDPVESAGLRILHESCAPTRSCTDCHSPTAHGSAVSWARSSNMEMCFDCHGAEGIDDACDLCHSERLPSDRVQSGTFAVTHGPKYLQTHGMGDMQSCGPCHDESKCVGCHGAGLPHGPDFVKKHPEPSVSPAARCDDCHDKESFCLACHGYAMPHAASFLPEHSTIVKRDGPTGCLRCHEVADCDTCHVAHVHPTTTEQLGLLGVDVPGLGE